MSDNYSVLERKLAFFIRKFPKLKSNFKYVYQYLNYFFNKKDYLVKTNYELQEINFEDYETFFGYYDKSPVNNDGSRVLFQATKYPTHKKPDGCKHPVLVLVKDLETNQVLFKDEVCTYNWQQGTKLQWIDKDSFIYNSYDFEKKQYISKKITLVSNSFSVEIYNFPIYDCNARYGWSLNYDRLQKMRPDYGYLLGDVRMSDCDGICHDGIFKLDFSNNSHQLIYSFEDMMNLKPLDSMRRAKHKCNHIMVAPDGKSMMFLHRWYDSDGVKHDRLVWASTQEKEMKVLLDDDMVSHCFWIDNERIITFSNTYSEGNGYYIVNTKTSKIDNIDELSSLNLGDGHPNVFNNQEVLFDTYPNRSRIRKLYKFSFTNKKTEVVAEFFEPFKFYGETRCDLHPRWLPDGSVSVDSVHSGRRALYILKNT